MTYREMCSLGYLGGGEHPFPNYLRGQRRRLRRNRWTRLLGLNQAIEAAP